MPLELLTPQRSDVTVMNRDAYPDPPEPLEISVYDNHTHLDLAFHDQLLSYSESLDFAQQVGVAGVVQVGVDLDSSVWAAELAQKDARVLAAVALHPNEAPEVAVRGELEAQIDALDGLASLERVRAIGETGLDFFRTPAGKMRHYQTESFEAHIALAKKHAIALQIHDRDAHEEVVQVLHRVQAPQVTVFHCFSGDVEFARLCAEQGWYLSFSGTVTFKNAPGLREALKAVPKELILVETDAPFLTPMPVRGRPNAPYLLPHTVRVMAEVCEMELEDLCVQLAQNTQRVYGLWHIDRAVQP